MTITHHNGELRATHIGESVSLRGWVAKSRRMGGLIFIDLRDRFGLTQLTIHQDHQAFKHAELLRSEFIIYVQGTVVERQSKNAQMPTGDIEVEIVSLEVINTSKTPPIMITDETDALEDTRLKYRYLDLRRPVMQKTLMMRSQITQAIRHVLIEKGFYELETPILGKSTPEGARDFLVPSRLYEGAFYALPQSPQIFKQLYMVAGLEKYFQVAKCFRDEDLRADRQLEFTQIDIEASFVTQDDVMAMIEDLLAYTFKTILQKDIQTPFKRLPYDQAMDMYGSDKPDTRFDMTFSQLSDSMIVSDSTLFSGHMNKYIRVPAALGRKQIDGLTEVFKKQGGHILAYLKFDGSQYSGSLNKHLTEEAKADLKLSNEETILAAIGSKKQVFEPLGVVRVHVAKQLSLVSDDVFNFLWVTDFPLFEYDEQDGRFYAKHHPFTAPKHPEEMLTPHEAKANAYDIVLNGYELGGGSIRIHQEAIQKQMFETLGLDAKTVEERFGFFTEALTYGTPPHGGIALGLDRLVMLMTKTENIKDVVAFPKTQSARDVMMDAPSQVDPEQLLDVHLEVKK